ncbi:MAG: hypothetical protein H2076_02880 [Planctomycetes bacterium]|nr:hypothetical protein [Planctomycetota bacterium]
MSILSKKPLFPAVLLTAVICGAVIFLIGMPGEAIGDSGPVPEAVEPAYASGDEILIQDLIDRIERLEGELNRVQNSSQQPQMMAMLEGFKSEIEEFRENHSNQKTSVESDSSEDSPVEASEDDFTVEDTKKSVIHEQVFSFEGPVVPEALVLIQGNDAGHPIFVEVMDRHGNWVEVYTQNFPSGLPTSETWIECPGAPMTESVRIFVEGGSGVETVAAENAESLYWSSFSD